MVGLVRGISCAFVFASLEQTQASSSLHAQRGPQQLPTYQPQHADHADGHVRQQSPPQLQHLQQPQQQYMQQQHQDMYQQSQNQQQAYQQPHQPAYHQMHPQSYQQPQYQVQHMTQEVPQDNQYRQTSRRQDGNTDAMDAMYPLTTAHNGPFKHGMSVLARNNMDFGNLVIKQGTKGQIVFKEEDSLVVKWDGIGDLPAAPSQLVPVDSGPTDDDEEFFFPQIRRKVEPKVVEKTEDVEVEPVLSLARMEENRASETEKRATDIDATV